MNQVPPDDQRHPIESIASDVAESLRGGRRSSIEPLVDANPELENELRDLLPVIQRLEKARQTHAERPGGLATLGAARPDRLGDYELIRQIGRGGMGVVFEAVQQTLGRKVAVKVLPKSLLAGGDQLARFKHEAKMAASLHHTNIVPVFGVGDDHGFHYYVMQRIEGRGLDRVLTDGPKLSPREVAELGRQAATALAYAHQQNVLHRDIKPANLIVNDEHQLWVTDFGVAKAIESEASTRTGDVVGTLRYMAPEQIIGVTDVRSDIYSLGVTLYELLAGRPAMDDASIREALVARRPAPAPPPLRQLNPSVPRDLETILDTAMSIDLDRRYASADQMADDLQRFLDHEPISVRRISIFESSARWARRNPAIAALSALSAVLLFVVAVASTLAYLKVNRALDGERIARTKAEQTAQIASGALDEVYSSFARSPDVEVRQFSAAPALSAEVAVLLEKLLDYYDDLASQSDSASKSVSGTQLQRSSANARYAMGDIHFQLGRYDLSIKSFRQSLQDYRDAAQIVPDNTGDERAKLRESRIRNRIGEALRLSDSPTEAKAEHRQVLQLLESLASEDADLTAEIDFEKARTHYLIAARLRPGMGSMSKPPLFIVEQLLPTELAMIPPRRGNGPGGPGGPGELGPGRQGPGELGPGRQGPGELGPGRQGPGGPGELAPGRLGPARLGGLDRGPGRRPPPRGARPGRGFGPRWSPRMPKEYGDADLSHLDQAVKILRGLLQRDPQHVGYQLALAASLRQLTSDSIQSRTAAETELEQEAIGILKALHGRYQDDATIGSELAETLSELTVFDGDMSLPQIEAIFERLKISLSLCESLAISNPNVPTYTNRLVHTNFKLGVMLDRFAELCPAEERREFLQDAASAFRRASQRCKMLHQQYPDASGYAAWHALIMLRQGENAIRTDLNDQAERTFTRAVRAWETLVKENGDERVMLVGLQRAYHLLSHAQRILDKDDEADQTQLMGDFIRSELESLP